ncbi:MAG TPA: coenzyme F420-0:L-glutamate ligase [Nocardioidaceae bacterium]
MITARAVEGIGEVRPGDDLAGLVVAGADLRDGDVLVVTSKVVSKAEGRVVRRTREEAVAEETTRVVARRGGTTIARTRHGLVMAAAGIDASNTPPGTLVLLPSDPDASARSLREVIAERTGANVAVVVSDTSGRAWRTGQTDIAVGAAGLLVLEDHAGRDDGYGNLLAVTAPALADEVAATADLVTGKLSRSPAVVLRGLDRLVLPRGEHGPGAAALVRPEAQDMFGLGSREAVLSALTRSDVRGFGAPVDPEELVAALRTVLPQEAVVVVADGPEVQVTLPRAAEQDGRILGVAEERARVLCFAMGWRRPPSPGDDRVTDDRTLRFAPAGP